MMPPEIQGVSAVCTADQGDESFYRAEYRAETGKSAIFQVIDGRLYIWIREIKPLQGKPGGKKGPEGK
jgi:hypothetical protein